jgi:hypothetical protein
METTILRQGFVTLNFGKKRPRITDEKAGIEEMAADEQPHFAPGVAAKRPVNTQDDDKK